WLWHQFVEAVTLDHPVMESIWVIVLLCAPLGGLIASSRSRRSRPARDGQPDLALFAAISLIVGVIGNVLFLRLLSYYMQPWYFLCLMAVIAAGADAAQRAVPMGQGFRVLGVALTAVALISILFGPLYKRSTTRRTTIDEV